MPSRIIRTSNGGIRILRSPSDRDTYPVIPAFTAEELWTAHCELRREAIATALRTTRCPENARLLPLVGSRRVLLAILDEEDYAKLSRFTWFAWTRRGYKLARAVAKIDGCLQQMSRLVMGVGHRYDHVGNANGNTLDNRKANLQILPREDRYWLHRKRVSFQNTSLAPSPLLGPRIPPKI